MMRLLEPSHEFRSLRETSFGLLACDLDVLAAEPCIPHEVRADRRIIVTTIQLDLYPSKVGFELGNVAFQLHRTQTRAI